MEKRVTGIYFAVLLIGILYAIYAAFSFRIDIDTRVGEDAVIRWDDHMEMVQEGDVYFYRGVLPEDTSEKVIVYNTVHMYLEVFIDGNMVYELNAEKDRAVKTTGYCWNAISLAEEDAGREIVFQVTPVYCDSKPQGNFYLRETLLLTHICLLLFVAVIVGMTIHEITTNELTRQIKLNCICVLVVLASTVLELAIYRIGNVSTPLGSIGFLFYIAVMGIINVRRSRRMMAQAKESALYRKLAFTDELTGLSNRTAFREDLKKRLAHDKTTGEEKILPTVIFMFDLNDLKKCNDTYGHDYGDRYIKMAANALKKLFVQAGKCYRIGGDEFCAWAPYISEDDINEKLQMLEQDIQELNDRGFVVTVSIAAGYAVYQEGEDGSGLYSTMKRADVMMYEKKQKYKKAIDSYAT